MSSFPEYTAVVQVTAAQIKSMHTSPVQLVPGQAGCIVDIKSILLVYHAGTQVFNPTSTDFVGVFTGTIPNIFSTYTNGVCLAEGFTDQASDQLVWAFPWWDTGAQNTGIDAVALSAVIGSGIFLWYYDTGDVFPGGANWTQGNGTITAYVEYSYIVA
jgi:hypothetical protein